MTNTSEYIDKWLSETPKTNKMYYRVLENSIKKSEELTLSLYELTNLERYGVRRPAQNPDIKEKSESTSLERYGFAKHKLVEEGFDPNKTADQIMIERGIYKIYDCGNLKYVWPRK